MAELIPHVRFDSWGHYQWVGDYPDHPAWQRPENFQKIVFLRSDVKKVILEMEEFQKPDANGIQKTQQEVDSWVEAQKSTNEELVCHLQRIEDWVECSKRSKLAEAGEYREQRIRFFKEKAESMNPPLSADALSKTLSYRRAIVISSKPTENAWKTLLPKLGKERAKAEAECQKEKDHQHKEELRRRKKDYERTESDRKARDRPEQVLVLELADEIISTLVDSEDERTLKVADADFIHLVFRRVFQEYESLADSKKSRAGEYRLLMDDVKMIYEKRLMPFMEEWDVKRIRAATLVRCPVCPKKEGLSAHQDLATVMQHVFEKHASTMADFEGFWFPRNELPLRVAFPWCRVEWPRNLPMLPSHQRVPGRWDLHAQMKYERQPERKKENDIWRGRTFSSDINSPPPEQFVNNVLYVLSLLDHTKLQNQFKTMIANKYALLRYSRGRREQPPPGEEVLADLQVAFVRKGIKGVYEFFRCRACRKQAEREGRTRNRSVTRLKPFGELVQHYFTVHRDSWPKGMIDFPPGEDLLAVLQEPGSEVAREIFDRLFPLKSDATKVDPILRGEN